MLCHIAGFRTRKLIQTGFFVDIYMGNQDNNVVCLFFIFDHDLNAVGFYCTLSDEICNICYF